MQSVALGYVRGRLLNVVLAFINSARMPRVTGSGDGARGDGRAQRQPELEGGALACPCTDQRKVSALDV